MQWNLYLLRKEMGYTQKNIAEYLSVSENSYRNKEKGVTQFTADEMFQISDLFALPIEHIFLPRKLGDNEFKPERENNTEKQRKE